MQNIALEKLGLKEITISDNSSLQHRGEKTEENKDIIVPTVASYPLHQKKAQYHK
jgi:hypothetical protein